MRLFANRKTRHRNLLLVLIPFILIMIVCGILAFINAKDVSDSLAGTKIDDKSVIESMDYHLRSDATELQTQLFNELSDAVKDGSDNYLIASLVAKNFVADFYTWTNKDGSYDIGGMYYIFPHLKINIYKQARDSYYKYLTYYINTYGKDKLLEVESVDVEYGDNVNKYEYNGKEYDSYFITTSWTYKSGSPLYTNELITKEYFTVIYDSDSKRFEIVQAYGDY